MKKMMKTLALVAAAAMGFTACQNDFEEQVQVKDSVVVNFVADSAESRTSVDTSGTTPVFSWNAEESFAVLEQTTSLAEATAVEYTKVDEKANIKATFNANPDKSEYEYVTIYPASGYESAESLASVTLNLPSVQTMAEGSYDPAADLMVSEVVTTSAQPTEAQMVRFTRLAAVVKMSLKNFGVALGDKVQSVTFEANGKALAGKVSVDLTDLFEDDGTTHKFTAAAEMSSSVTVNTTSAGDIYFTTLPTTLAAGDAYTITIVTDQYLYVKQGTIPEGKTLAFAAGMVTRFGVDMNGVAPGNKWKLVKDASTLKSGDVVTFVNATATFNNYYALSAKYNSTNYPYAATTAIVKLGDYFYHPISEVLADRIQQVTLSKRYDDKVAFDLYNAADEFTDDDKSGFYSSTSSNQNFKLQAYPNNNTLFYITIEDGVTSVVAKDADSEVKYLQFKPGSNATSSHYFQLRKKGDDYVYPVCIYKLEGVENREIPVTPASVTVPDEDELVVVAEEGATEATVIEDVVFDYVGPWAISVSDNAEWLTLAYDAANNSLTYIAEANVGAKRDAVATITASLEGEESLTWSFNLVQKGASQEITIAEFANKGKDVDTVYKLTGIITEIPSSTSGKWKLADENGNTAQVQYLKTEDGAYVKGNVDVKVGDVISLTTVVAGTTVGLGGNSTYPSIYKGHYSLAATSSGSVAYEGGDVTVNVEVVKSGHIDAPSAISDAEVAIDTNIVTNYSFTDNGDGTATAVLSFGINETSGMREVELTFAAGSPLVTKATITVSQDVNPALKKGWWLVTDVNDLQAGDKLIIAATGLDYAISTETNTNNRKSKPITKNGASLQNVADNIQQYALEIDANGLYSFKGTLGTDVDKYIYAASSSSNYMKVSTTLDDNGKFTVEIASDGAATVVAQGANTRNHMQYNNKSTSSPAFYCTNGSFGDVCFYKLYE